MPWPSIGMPIMSQASRSNQSAAGHTGSTLATGSPSSSQTCTRTRAGSSETRRRWYETEKRFGFGSGTRASPWVDGSWMSRPAAVPMYPETSCSPQPR